MPTVPTNGIETYYERRGEGPSLVLVHGPAVPHTVWRPQLDALSEDHTVVAFDVRGHGRTGPSEREPYSVSLFAEDLAALIEELDLQAPVVGALSMGSFVALTYAAHHPDRLAGLVLVDPFAPEILTPGEHLLRRGLMPAFASLARVLGFPRIEDAYLRLAEAIPHAKIQRLDLSWPRMATAEFVKVVHALAHGDQEPVDLAEIEVPTLLVQGADDVGTVHHQTQHLAEALPDARVEAIADAGHGAHLVHPEAVNPVVRRFLAQAHAAAPR